MSFVIIDSNKIKVGDPITKELWDAIKNNFDDIDTRVNNLAVSGSNVYIINEAVNFLSYKNSNSDFWYYKVPVNMVITGMNVQLFSKDGISSGSFTVDLQKGTSTDNSTFNTVLTSAVTFNFAIDVSYSVKSASLDPSSSILLAGDVLRLNLSSYPAGFKGRVLFLIWGS